MIGVRELCSLLNSRWTGHLELRDVHVINELAALDVSLVADRAMLLAVVVCAQQGHEIPRRR